MDNLTIDMGYIEMYPEYADEIIIEQPVTWIESWDTEAQEVAQRIWNEYVTDALLLTEESIADLDALVFAEFE